MTLLADFVAELKYWVPFLILLADLAILAVCIPWVLMTKANSSSAVAWILLLILLPGLGFLFFLLFGHQHVHRPLKRKRRHRAAYQIPPDPTGYDRSHAVLEAAGDAAADTHPAVGSPHLSASESLARLAYKLGAYAVTPGNQIDFLHEGSAAFAAKLADIAAARHHIHLEYYIFQPDPLGRQFLDLLIAKAKEGVEVRVLYDAMGCYRLPRRFFQPLCQAGGRCSVFLPINILRRRLQINMRNHRKIMVVDGVIGYVGGLNIGDEYQGKSAYYGPWRDVHMRLQGPAVTDLQRTFSEDWSFAAGETLTNQGKSREAHYFQVKKAGGPYAVQVVDSGPDREVKLLRELVFAAIARARRRIWIISPYFVPDEGILDALRLAAHAGLDVRYLGQLFPDQRIPQYASRFHWGGLMAAGMKIYQYRLGMIHSKVLLVDDDLAMVGTANMDNRSMYLNFEVTCLIYSAAAVRELEAALAGDFAESILVNPTAFAGRSFASRLLENACRLLSPVL